MKSMLFICLMVVLGFSDLAVARGGHVAIFKTVSGNMHVLRNKVEIPGVAGMPLMQSDIILSGPGATGGVVFRDGTRLTVGASSEVEISKYLFKPAESEYAFSLYMKKGTAIYSSGDIGRLSPESVQLNTPRATVGVRGTRFIIQSEVD